MATTRRLTLFTAAVLMAAAPVSAAPREVLTVDEAVALALANSHRVDMARRDVERAEERVGAARTRRLPSFELQAIGGTTLNPIRVSFPEGSFGTFPATGPIPSADTVVTAPRAVSGNVSATLAQPLTQLHRIGLGTKMQELSREVEKERLRDIRGAIAAEVRRLYYGLVQTQSAIRAKEEQVRVYRELDRVVAQQVAAEVALASDRMQVQARLASEEYELAARRGDFATGKEQMNHFLGRDLARDFDVAEMPEATADEGDLARALEAALSRRPDLAQARLSVQQADTDHRIKKAELIPDVSLALQYNSFINVDLLPRNVAQVGLQLKWEPFDWGRRSKERAEKRLQIEQAKTSARAVEDRARLEVAQTFRRLDEARLLIEAGRRAREAAAEHLRVVSTRHRQDAALLKDVLDAEAAASAAQAQYDRAVTTFWTARADFRKALGEEL